MQHAPPEQRRRPRQKARSRPPRPAPRPPERRPSAPPHRRGAAGARGHGGVRGPCPRPVHALGQTPPGASLAGQRHFCPAVGLRAHDERAMATGPPPSPPVRCSSVAPIDPPPWGPRRGGPEAWRSAPRGRGRRRRHACAGARRSSPHPRAECRTRRARGSRPRQRGTAEAARRRRRPASLGSASSLRCQRCLRSWPHVGGPQPRWLRLSACSPAFAGPVHPRQPPLRRPACSTPTRAGATTAARKARILQRTAS
mmetsp:Transcript_141517/g.452427  ORF Transcript_141517/g.452427 Transcript_141517/m.452427 type:complete len:255 (+) Transcript_141517:478-1242(+)